jgi:hypothetical protein
MTLRPDKVRIVGKDRGSDSSEMKSLELSGAQIEISVPIRYSIR